MMTKVEKDIQKQDMEKNLRARERERERERKRKRKKSQKERKRHEISSFVGHWLVQLFGDQVVARSSCIISERNSSEMSFVTVCAWFGKGLKGK